MNRPAPPRVAYLGPAGTFTHQATLAHFGGETQPTGHGTIAAVFAAIADGSARYGVVPVENSSEGMVAHTLDCFVRSPLQILAEVLLPVEHCLIAAAGTTDSAIERVRSHPQALAQCAQWLASRLPAAQLLASASTSEAVQACRDDPKAAAIGSDQAARAHGVAILHRAIQDSADNVTRFLVIGDAADAPAPSDSDKTSLLLVLGDQPGALYEALRPLSEANINLSKIESRPSRLEAWSYAFFLDLDGSASDERVASAIEAMKPSCRLLRVLGSYAQAPRGS